ncbi:hypothetical protein N7931_11870 [Catenovulum sp. 2E275]|uniref:hypothetical protein n=1 Tax=Catenovulum sp. 2E275 TaxID=2980497 RepID=UPI0021D0A7B6|nr:hypothetical protein [Catenovulum sp. 2E275]MCU4676324.1 hypothetical protein [Catenovulum sp. 2E275]
MKASVKFKLLAMLLVGLLTSSLAYALFYHSNNQFIENIAKRSLNNPLKLTQQELSWYLKQDKAKQLSWAQNLLTALNNQNHHWTDLATAQLPQSLILHWANFNHIPSQFYLAQLSKNQYYKVYWLKKIASGVDKPDEASKANIQLAKHYENTSTKAAKLNYQQALALNNINAYRFEYAKFLIKQGYPKSEWNTLIEHNQAALSFTQNDLFYYFNSLGEVINAEFSTDIQCARPIQLITSNYSQLNKLKITLGTLLDLNFFRESGFCIIAEHWSNQLSDKQLQNAESLDFTQQYWLIELSGLTRAYRQGNRIYLPSSFNSQVMGHELAHWLGFEDEYQLNQAKAQQRCFIAKNEVGNVLAQNLIIFQMDYYFKHKSDLLNWMRTNIPWFNYIKNPQDWIIQTKQGFKLKLAEKEQGIGFYPAHTCNEMGVISVKPVFKATFMQNHAFYIPKLYKKIIL